MKDHPLCHRRAILPIICAPPKKENDEYEGRCLSATRPVLLKAESTQNTETYKKKRLAASVSQE